MQADSVSGADFRFSVITSKSSSDGSEPAGGAFVLTGSQTDGEAIGADMERRLLDVESVVALDLDDGEASIFVLSSAMIGSESIRTGTVKLGISEGAEVVNGDGTKVLLGAGSGTASIEALVDTEAPILEGLSRPDTAIVAGNVATITVTFSGFTESELDGEITASNLGDNPDISVTSGTGDASGKLFVEISGTVAIGKNSNDIVISFGEGTAIRDGAGNLAKIGDSVPSGVFVENADLPELTGIVDISVLEGEVFTRSFGFSDTETGASSLILDAEIFWVDGDGMGQTAKTDGTDLLSGRSWSVVSGSSSDSTDGSGIDTGFVLRRSSGGELFFEGSSDFPGEYSVEVSVDDGEGGVVYGYFVVSVMNVNDAPEVSAGFMDVLFSA